ncbi:MAG TPA: TonB family protein [Acidiferrobacterales bacterium]
MLAYYHSPDLPWTLDAESEERYRRIKKRIAILFLVLAVLIPLLPTPEPDRQQVEEVPPRLAKLLMEQRQPPPPPPVHAPQPEVGKPKPAPKKVEPKKETRTVERARDKAMRSGLLAFKDDLAALRSDPAVESVRSTPLTQGAKTAARSPERSMITSGAARASAGINTAALSRDTGGRGLAGRATTRVESPVGGGAGSGAVQRGQSGKAGRSIEDIQLIFDKNKSAIYALYNRALRQDPTLQGKVVLKITIDPSGRVTACQVVSSELRSPDLERKLSARVMQFNFGARDVGVMVVTYPIDFLPS